MQPNSRKTNAALPWVWRAAFRVLAALAVTYGVWAWLTSSEDTYGTCVLSGLAYSEGALVRADDGQVLRCTGGDWNRMD